MDIKDLYYRGQLYVFPEGAARGNTYSCTRLYKNNTHADVHGTGSLYYEHLEAV